MTLLEAIELRAIIESDKAKSYRVIDTKIGGERIYDIHEWANGKRYQGAFKIVNSYDTSYWLILIEWKPKIYYLVLFPEKLTGPLIEIHSLRASGSRTFHWTYKPTKRDGQTKLLCTKSA